MNLLENGPQFVNQNQNQIHTQNDCATILIVRKTINLIYSFVNSNHIYFWPSDRNDKIK